MTKLILKLYQITAFVFDNASGEGRPVLYVNVYNVPTPFTVSAQLA